MLAISSIKPLVESNPHNLAYQELQSNAVKSWTRTFDEVVLVNGDKSKPVYNDPKISIIYLEDCPAIKYLAEVASNSDLDYVAILNADIVVNEEINLVRSLMAKVGCRAATSRRWHFTETTANAKLAPGDNGLDIFIATPEAWDYVSGCIPEGLRIGVPGWDNWLIQCFHKRYGHSFRNFTKWQCVFHPFHHVNERPFNHDVHVDELTPHIKEL